MGSLVNLVTYTDVIVHDVTKSIHYENGQFRKSFFGGVITITGALTTVYFAIGKLITMFAY